MFHNKKGTQFDLIEEAADFVSSQLTVKPKIAIVLGSGLGSVAASIKDAKKIPYEDIPHMPQSAAPGHEGRFVGGQLEGVPVICMQGRVHLYEGYSAEQVVFPIRLMNRLGADTLILTNAAGGITEAMDVGTIMAIDDHINYMMQNPLTGLNDERFGVRFPDMTTAYDKNLRTLVDSVASKLNIAIEHGVYLGTPGPSLETPAEIRAFRTMGADAVGMSTVPEVIAARHLGMRVLGLSMIANKAAGLGSAELTSDDINEAAAQSAPRIAQLITGVVAANG